MDFLRAPFELIVLNGEPPSEELLRDAAAKASRIVAADGGANVLKRYGIAFDVVIGDLDSFEKGETITRTKTRPEVMYDAGQASNDFEKCLSYLSKNNEALQHDLVVLGMTGKRTDHTLTNFSVMRRFSDRFKSIVAIDEYAYYFFLDRHRKHHIFEDCSGCIVSLVPAPAAEGIVTDGFRYPLDNESLAFGEREGLSNVIERSPATISLQSGTLLVILNRN